MEVEKPRVAFTRDFPANCGTNKASSVKGVSGFLHYIREFPQERRPNPPKITKIGSENRLGSAKDSGFGNDLSSWRRLAAAVKSKLPVDDGRGVSRNPQNLKGKQRSIADLSYMRSGDRMFELKNTQKFMGMEIKNYGENVSGERAKVTEMLMLFRKKCTEISRSGRGIKRVDITASSELKNEGKFMNRSALVIGSVPGVEVGDKFHYRIELSLVGLHKHFERGIDSMEWGGSRAATCIVASENHLDKMTDPNALIYIGEGGVLKRHAVGVPPDMELKGGNRALWTSMKEHMPVRVVRGLVLERGYGHKVLYVYDGLYEVRECVKKKGPLGNMIFEFQMSRCSGQPAVPWLECRRYQFLNFGL